MLIAVPQDLVLYPGFRFDPVFQFFTDHTHLAPFDLTGYTASLTIGANLLVLTTAGGGLAIATGAIRVNGTAIQTATVPLGVWDWYLQWTSGSGAGPDCPVAGKVTVEIPGSDVP